MKVQLASLRGGLILETSPVRLLARRTTESSGQGLAAGRSPTNIRVLAKFTLVSESWIVQIRDSCGARVNAKFIPVRSRFVLRLGMRLELDGIQYEVISPDAAIEMPAPPLNPHIGLVATPMDWFRLCAVLVSWPGPWRFIDVLYQMVKLFPRSANPANALWPYFVLRQLVQRRDIDVQFVVDSESGTMTTFFSLAELTPEAVALLNACPLEPFDPPTFVLRASTVYNDGRYSPQLVSQMLAAHREFAELARIARHLSIRIQTCSIPPVLPRRLLRVLVTLIVVPGGHGGFGGVRDTAHNKTLLVKVYRKATRQLLNASQNQPAPDKSGSSGCPTKSQSN